MFAATAMGVINSRHKYWRLYVTATGNGAGTSLSEIQMRGVVGGADLCTGGFATDPRGTNGTYPAPNAFDDTSSLWICEAYGFEPYINDDAPPDWIRYEFASPVKIVQYVLTSGSNTSTFQRRPTAWKFEWSDDGTNWVTVDTQTFTGWTDFLESVAFTIP